MILGAEDVGEDRVLLPFLDQPHRNAGDGAADRNARVHHRERAAADGGHRARPVRLEDLGDDAQRVREVGEVGEHGLQRALGQVAVADLATRRAAHRAHLAGGERREVVVQHERARRLARAVDRVEALRVVRGAERDGDERLRLAAREQRRAVRTRKEARVDRDRTDLVRRAPVDALLGAEHLRPERVVLQIAEHALDLLGVVREIGRQRLGDLLLHLLHRLDARVLVLLVQRLADLHVGERLHAIREPLGDGGPLPRHLLGAARLRHQLFLIADQLTDAALRDRERLDDVLLADLERTTLDHHDRIVRTGNDELHVAVLELLQRRIEHPVALNPADADGGDGTTPRRPTRSERVRRRGEREHVGLVLLISRDDVAEHLHFVLEAFREERADGAVDDPAAQDLVVARAALTLDEAAGDLARGVRLFLVFDREREEGERTLGLAHRDGRQNHRIAVRDQA